LGEIAPGVSPNSAINGRKRAAFVYLTGPVVVLERVRAVLGGRLSFAGSSLAAASLRRPVSGSLLHRAVPWSRPTADLLHQAGLSARRYAAARLCRVAANRKTASYT